MTNAVVQVFHDCGFVGNEEKLKQSPDIDLVYGDLTEVGQGFIKALELDKWMKSLDRMKVKTEAKYLKSLSRRAAKYA